MAPWLQHADENEFPCTSDDPPDSLDVASWDVAPGDTVVVRGRFTRAEIRAYVDLIERLYPDAGMTVVFMPPGVEVERVARMAEGWRDRSAEAR